MPPKTATHAGARLSAPVHRPQAAAHASRRAAESSRANEAIARAMTAPIGALAPADILALQRVAGNRAVERLLAERMQNQQPDRLAIQAKLAVGAANDLYEREADSIAATVMQKDAPSLPSIQRQPAPEDDEERVQAKPLAPSITPLIQRQEIPEEEEDEGGILIQRRSDGGLANVEPGVEGDIEQARGSGQALPIELRARMERSFGVDFSRVRVHTGGAADSLNRSLQSRAFTTGRDIFFRMGEYNPANRQGQRLIAHELTHVVQQNGGRSGKPGLSVQRAPGKVIQRSATETLQEDRELWKVMPTSWKASMVALAPVLGALSGGPRAIAAFYRLLAGQNPGKFRAGSAGFSTLLLSPLVAALGVAQGVLRGLAFGLGNPLYSAGKRLVRGLQAAVEVVNEGRGFYAADPTGKYGNRADGSRRENFGVDTKSDLTNYLLLLTSAAAAAGAVSTQYASIWNWGQNAITDTVPMLGESGKAISQMGAVSSVAGAVTSLVDAQKGYAEWKDRARSKEQRQIGKGRALSGVAGATQQSATAAFQIGNLTQTGVSAGAQVAAGGAAVVTGSVDVLRGVYAHSKATQNIARLTSLQERYRTDPARQTPQGTDIGKAAQQGASTQEMRKTMAKATVAKGLLTAAGGVLLAASVATPIGWALLGVGALIGGAFALKRALWNKRNRKKEIAMRELGVTEAQMEDWQTGVEIIEKHTKWRSKERKEALEHWGPDPLQKKLDEHGFKSVGHFYANYINYLAEHLYKEGLDGKVAFTVQVLEAAGSRRAHNRLRRRWLGDMEAVNKLTYKELKPSLELEGIRPNMEGNHYPEVEELLQGIGLRFDWRKDPPQPTPDKIGKALDE
jgi:hypothetical protein